MSAAAGQGRRKSNGGSSTSSMGGGGGSGSGSGRAARLDPSLTMSSRTSTDSAKPLARTHKSSERLHRLNASGHGSSNVNLSKRSKSYSQIMSATHAGQGKKKAAAQQSQQKQKQRVSGKESDGEMENDEEGWTSSDQAETPEKHRSDGHVGGSDEEDSDDEGIVLGRKQADSGKAKTLSAKQPIREVFTAPAIERSDTNTTIKNMAGPEAGPSGQQASVNGRADTEASKPAELRAMSGPHEDVSVAQDASSHVQTDFQRLRTSSSASARTLTSERALAQGGAPSPKSLRSIRSRSGLFPRDSRNPVALPKITSTYAFAGEHLLDDNESDVSNIRSSESHAGEMPNSFDLSKRHRSNASEIFEHKRKSSADSSRSSFINLMSASPSMALLSSQTANAGPSSSKGSPAVEAMHRVSSSGLIVGSDQSRQRTRSLQNGNEAAKLASKLRMTNIGTESSNRNSSTGAGMSEASRMLASSGSKYFSSAARSGAQDSATAKALAQYHKPTVSTFVKREDDFHASKINVEHGDLYDKHFAKASLPSGEKASARRKLKDAHEVDVGDYNTNDVIDESDYNDDEAPLVRYAMDYGLSGPAISHNATAQALLSSCLDHDEFESSWAPALAQAAGLGAEDGAAALHQRMLSGSVTYDGGMPILAPDALQAGGHLGSSGGFLINGPNATPLHFLHGLTNTDDSPFPLDALDIPLPPAIAAAVENYSAQRQHMGNYFDAKNLRAVAQTWAALNTAKNHIMTRRYVDPMRESMERVGAASGIKTSMSASPAAIGAPGAAKGARGSANHDASMLLRGGGAFGSTTSASRAHGTVSGSSKRQSTSSAPNASGHDGDRNAQANRSTWRWRDLFGEQAST